MCFTRIAKKSFFMMGQQNFMKYYCTRLGNSDDNIYTMFKFLCKHLVHFKVNLVSIHQFEWKIQSKTETLEIIGV